MVAELLLSASLRQDQKLNLTCPWAGKQGPLTIQYFFRSDTEVLEIRTFKKKRAIVNYMNPSLDRLRLPNLKPSRR